MTNNPPSSGALLEKASRACSSAKLLLEDGDIDGACNRAYYAMFDAARAALLFSSITTDTHIGRTHSGLIAAFGKQLVKNGSVPKSLGKNFNRAHELRQLADYTGEAIDTIIATELVLQSSVFVDYIKQHICNSPPDS